MVQIKNFKAENNAHSPCLAGTHHVDETHSSQHARLLHMHETELELFYVYSGAGRYMVDGYTYQVSQGDMVICNAGILHGEDPDDWRKMRTYSIALTGVQFEGLLPNHLTAKDTMSVIHCGALSEQIGEMMRLVYLLSGGSQPLQAVCQHTALAVLGLIRELLCSRKRHEAIRSTAKAGLLARRIRNYLDIHYCEPLSLQMIGDALGVSEYHAAHVFKAELGISPMQYVMRRRMGEAQTMLMDTNRSIADIADRLGYSNPWNFSTAFGKCVGMTPSQYRQSFQELRTSAAHACMES